MNDESPKLLKSICFLFVSNVRSDKWTPICSFVPHNVPKKYPSFWWRCNIKNDKKRLLSHFGKFFEIVLSHFCWWRWSKGWLYFLVKLSKISFRLRWLRSALIVGRYGEVGQLDWGMGEFRKVSNSDECKILYARVLYPLPNHRVGGYLKNNPQLCRNGEGARGPPAPSKLIKSVNPIPTGKSRLSLQIATGTPNVFHLPASLTLVFICPRINVKPKVALLELP